MDEKQTMPRYFVDPEGSLSMRLEKCSDADRVIGLTQKAIPSLVEVAREAFDKFQREHPVEDE